MIDKFQTRPHPSQIFVIFTQFSDKFSQRKMKKIEPRELADCLQCLHHSNHYWSFLKLSVNFKLQTACKKLT